MARPYRFLALGVAGVFGVALASQFTPEGREAPLASPPGFLPVAVAAPAEVAFADTLKSGETLSELLARTKMEAEDARALLAELTRVQDPRSARAGLVLRYRTSTRTGAVRAAETRLDADRTLMVRRAGEVWAASVAEVPVRLSLYQALGDGDGGVPRAERQAIADVLADRIFAWKIDFSRDLRPGDTYRILLEREVRPDGTARSSRVLAVEFDLSGRRHDAYLFAAGGVEDYYDREGESLRRAFLRAPLEFRRISSAFSTGRFHPILKTVRAHNGIDYAAAPGTPIRAVGDGTIARAGWGGGYGNVVEIRHSRGYSSRYAHMRGFANGIRPGVRVKQGDVIGYVGSTGLSTGPHLHYEFHENGRPVNPNSIRYLTGDPVPAMARARFREAVTARAAALDRGDRTLRGEPKLAVRTGAEGGFADD